MVIKRILYDSLSFFLIAPRGRIFCRISECQPLYATLIQLIRVSSAISSPSLSLGSARYPSAAVNDPIDFLAHFLGRGCDLVM